MYPTWLPDGLLKIIHPTAALWVAGCEKMEDAQGWCSASSPHFNPFVSGIGGGDGPEDDDYYPDANEPYFLSEDQGYGTCPECGSALENWGAVSQGDGDLYDELGCPNCQEPMGKANLIWLDADDVEDYWGEDA